MIPTTHEAKRHDHSTPVGQRQTLLYLAGWVPGPKSGTRAFPDAEVSLPHSVHTQTHADMCFCTYCEKALYCERRLRICNLLTHPARPYSERKVSFQGLMSSMSRTHLVVFTCTYTSDWTIDLAFEWCVKALRYTYYRLNALVPCQSHCPMSVKCRSRLRVSEFPAGDMI
jgi:hypothetical protein